MKNSGDHRCFSFKSLSLRFLERDNLAQFLAVFFLLELYVCELLSILGRPIDLFSVLVDQLYQMGLRHSGKTIALKGFLGKWGYIDFYVYLCYYNIRNNIPN
jgi:hypothetical protein